MSLASNGILIRWSNVMLQVWPPHKECNIYSVYHLMENHCLVDDSFVRPLLDVYFPLDSTFQAWMKTKEIVISFYDPLPFEI